MRIRVLQSLLFLVTSIALTTRGPAQTGGTAGGVYTIEQGLVDANGVMIYYAAVGHGKPLLVVHGGPGASHDYFLPSFYAFARNHRLIFIDERGSGKSPRLDDPKLYSVENMVEDLEAVRKALKLGKVSLLGHSYGGVLAQAYSLKYQKNLTHLILASTFSSTREMNEVLAREKQKMPDEKRKRLDELEKAGLFDKGPVWEHGRYPSEYATLAWGDGYFPFLYGARPDPNYDPVSQNTTISWLLYREMWGSHGEFVIDGNLNSVEYVDKLPMIKVPTLIIVGDHDECDPALSKEMHEQIAGSKLVIVPNAGHMTFEDQPSFFVTTVSEFVHGSGTIKARR